MKGLEDNEYWILAEVLHNEIGGANRDWRNLKLATKKKWLRRAVDFWLRFSNEVNGVAK